jgi:hypothetical protein
MTPDPRNPSESPKSSTDLDDLDRRLRMVAREEYGIESTTARILLAEAADAIAALRERAEQRADDRDRYACELSRARASVERLTRERDGLAARIDRLGDCMRANDLDAGATGYPENAACVMARLINDRDEALARAETAERKRDEFWREWKVDRQALLERAETLQSMYDALALTARHVIAGAERERDEALRASRSTE